MNSNSKFQDLFFKKLDKIFIIGIIILDLNIYILIQLTISRIHI
jgi:hypothetical protein